MMNSLHTYDTLFIHNGNLPDLWICMCISVVLLTLIIPVLAYISFKE
ncbi:hypothetical protein PMW_103 [Pseudomonas phage phiPMW]|uniref:Uncharacterized protein n=1 Tax=Pseudomonas phage phiPMW TaxID=1815582 RepID=A0A1S5R1H8_9CAUD|nr:hypothetical protein FDG97_gp103 [Pseudomonas phage phiPMW]ANA49228.1 hypothetical protein PMW_103 [Pseudomonas phage phiPMW]